MSIFDPPQPIPSTTWDDLRVAAQRMCKWPKPQPVFVPRSLGVDFAIAAGRSYAAGIIVHPDFHREIVAELERRGES